jgi:hypothetical protein
MAARVLPQRLEGTVTSSLLLGHAGTDRHMIDGAKRKRRNGAKGEPRRKWYARWRAARFARHFVCSQTAGMMDLIYAVRTAPR